MTCEGVEESGSMGVALLVGLVSVWVCEAVEGNGTSVGGGDE